MYLANLSVGVFVDDACAGERPEGLRFFLGEAEVDLLARELGLPFASFRFGEAVGRTLGLFGVGEDSCPRRPLHAARKSLSATLGSWGESFRLRWRLRTLGS